MERVLKFAPPVLALLIVGIVVLFGNSQFGGFDQSLLVDVGYRMVSGQQPYTDFYVTTPLVFHFGVAAAYRLFGLHWASVVLFFGIFGALNFLWQNWILVRLGMDRKWSLLTTFTVQAVCTIYMSYWWYNPVTALLACTFFLSSVLAVYLPDSRSSWLSFLFSLALISWAKPNVAGPLIIGFSLVLLSVRGHRKPLLLTVGCAALLSLGALLWMGVWPTDVLKSYLSAASRARPSVHRFRQDRTLAEYRMSFAMIYGFLAWLVVAIGTRVRLKGPLNGQEIRALFLAGITTVVGLFAFYTNGESKLTDFPVWFLGILVGVAVILKWDFRNVGSFFRRSLATYCLVLLGVGMYLGYERQRVKLVGKAYFEKTDVARVDSSKPYFAGFHAGKMFRTTLKEIETNLKKVDLSGEFPVFFGPRVEFAYAAFGLPSPKGFPIFWWNDGVSFPVGDERLIIERFKKQAPRICFFFEDDYIYIPSEIQNFLKSNYTYHLESVMGVYVLKSDAQLKVIQKQGDRVGQGGLKVSLGLSR